MSTQIAQANTATVFKCPGHSELFHRYSFEKKATRRANRAVRNLLDNKDVVKADYKLLERKTVEGKESGYFKKLNRIFNYAVILNYSHVDNCEACSFYKEHNAETVTEKA